MKLVNFSRQLKIKIYSGEVFYLIIEAEKELRMVVEGLACSVRDQTDDWILSENDEILKKDQVTEIIFSPWMIDVNNRRIQKALLKQIEQFYQRETYSDRIRNFIEEMKTFLDDINLEMSHKFEYEIEEALPFIKECGIHFEEEEDILLRLNQYVRICAELLKKRLFIFVGLRQYLAPEELDIFVREISYLGVFVLCIENVCNGTEKHMILIDKDLCQVV